MHAPPLPGFLAALAPALDTFGYLAVAALITLEDFGIPVPGETVLIAAALYAGTGRLSIVAVGVIAVLAAICGDNIGYAIGRYGGRALILRFGRHVRLTSERLARAEVFFASHGGKIVVIARFVQVLRQLNGIIAGLARMPWPKFLIFNITGAALWVGTWATLGYVAGSHINAIYTYITRYSLYLLIVAGIAAAVLITRAAVRRRRPSTDEPAQDDGASKR
jgi:membrane protein DedA with SNARE-associated domain